MHKGCGASLPAEALVADTASPFGTILKIQVNFVIWDGKILQFRRL